MNYEQQRTTIYNSDNICEPVPGYKSTSEVHTYIYI